VPSSETNILLLELANEDTYDPFLLSETEKALESQKETPESCSNTYAPMNILTLSLEHAVANIYHTIHLVAH
jgi:hypothetical protein